MNRLAPSVLLLLLAVTAAALAASEDDPVLWPERERAFVLDGPGLLLDEERGEAILASSGEERTRLIDEFLAADPIPETSANELVEGIERRRRLAQSQYPTFLDDRARVLFLRGEPLERVVVECGQTFVPLEIWTYPETEVVNQVVFFRPNPDVPYRLWRPLLSKRVLYNSEMEYYLMQWEELGGRRIAKRFDLQTCDETPLVDDATGAISLALRSIRNSCLNSSQSQSATSF